MQTDEVLQAIVRMLEQAPSLGALVFLVIWQSRELERIRVALETAQRRERRLLREVAKLPELTDDNE